MSNNIYCTYLTIYSGNKLPPFYIGSTSVEKIEKGYRGTVCSKKYKQLWISEMKENPNLFKTKIITKHTTRKEALAKEEYFHRSLNVVKSTLYINQSYACKSGFFGISNFGELNCMNNPVIKQKHNVKVTSKEYRDNMRMIVTGRKASDESKQKMSKSAKICGVGKWNKGVPKSDFTKKKMSLSAKNRERIVCPKCCDGYTKANYNKHFNSCNSIKRNLYSKQENGTYRIVKRSNKKQVIPKLASLPEEEFNEWLSKQKLFNKLGRQNSRVKAVLKRRGIAHLYYDD